MEKERKHHRRSAFTNGLAVGFGIGCFATFVALAVTAMYYSTIAGQTFESIISNFSLPLTYFFVLGILFLIAGYIWERHEKQLKL